jgi:hypothetical protein
MEEAILSFAAKQQTLPQPPSPKRIIQITHAIPDNLKGFLGKTCSEWIFQTIATGLSWEEGILELWAGSLYDKILRDQNIIRCAGNYSTESNLDWSNLNPC